MDFKKLSRVGVIKTIRMNVHYFGLGGVFCPRIIAGRALKIVNMSGNVSAPKQAGVIRIGIYGTGINDGKYHRAIWDNSGLIKVNGKLMLGEGTRISNSGELEFGSNIRLTANDEIICKKRISIGDDSIISWETLIMDTDFHYIYKNETGQESGFVYPNQLNKPKDVIIGSHCWIGCRSLVLKGSKLPNNSIVAASSTITSVFEQENTIIANKRVVKENVCWKE